MTTHAAHALQGAIHAALSADTDVTMALGGARIHDAVPQKAPMPYIAFGPLLSRVAGAGVEEHSITLDVWSRARGQKEAQAVAGAIIARLHDGALTIAGHRLINLELDVIDSRRDSDTETYRASLRFRAVTEPDA